MVTFMEFQPPNICSIERADSRDRNTGGQSTGNKGGGGGGKSSGSGGGAGAYNGQGRPTPTPTTSYGAPVHTATGPTYGGISVAQSPSSWQNLNNQVNTYNDAARKWNAGTGASFGNFVNNMAPMGFSMQAPELNKPKTYVGGDYHLGVNPAQLAGSILGSASMLPGMGTLASSVLGKGYTALGGSNVMLGGGQVPGTFKADLGYGAGPVGQIAAANPSANPGMASMGGNPGRGTQSAFGPPGGAPFGAQPTAPGLGAPAAAPAAAPTFGAAHVPNHSLPQGYASLFPNSLSDQDKALLYAKALGGGMG